MRRLFIVAAALFALPSFAQSNVEHVFTIKEKDFIPEGIAYDSVTETFYVGSIHKNKITRIDKKGKVSDFLTSHQDSIGQVLGMKIDAKKGHLWACSNQGEGIVGGKAYVHQYDLRSGKLIHRYVYTRPGETHLFNDLTFSNGKVFISDSEGRSVMQLDPVSKTIDVLVKDDLLFYVNGITTLPGSKDLIAVSVRGFRKINTETKTMTPITFESFAIAGIDGLYFYKNSLVGIQNVFFPESISRFYLSDDRSKITTAEVLSANHEKYNVPTTGVIVGNELYFIANSFLNYYDKGKLEDPSKLEDVLIFKVKID